MLCSAHYLCQDIHACLCVWELNVALKVSAAPSSSSSASSSRLLHMYECQDPTLRAHKGYAHTRGHYHISCVTRGLFQFQLAGPVLELKLGRRHLTESWMPHSGMQTLTEKWEVLTVGHAPIYRWLNLNRWAGGSSIVFVFPDWWQPWEIRSPLD